jgi:hypothetical protein
MRRPKFDSQLVERGDGFTLREWRTALDDRVKCGPKRPEVGRARGVSPRMSSRPPYTSASR